MNKLHAVFDTEIIGLNKPVFLVCVKIVETGETFSFWGHQRKQMGKLLGMLDDGQYTWVSFNGIKFDAPLIAAAMGGHGAKGIKHLATKIIQERMMPWEIYKLAEVEPLEFDHIDLIEVAPGVMTSLKTYAGRMFYPSMVDLPFHHDKDLSPKEQKVLEQYCLNDLGVTEALFKRLQNELELRINLGAEHGLELRSKSDAQVAEAILKSKAKISGKPDVPPFVTYKRPAFIKTSNPVIADLIEHIETHHFKILRSNGSVLLPDWLADDPVVIKQGIYQVGIGGLHSKHDKCCHFESNNDYSISDFDVRSYYPTMILNCGYVPKMGGGKGRAFLDEYHELYAQRLAAKAKGDKKADHSLKIALNGTFGKLGSIYSSFYSPDLLLAVTITGQLNLLCLIDELSRKKDVEVLSANTDGIMLRYKNRARAGVLKVIASNAKRTGFEYEETHYRKVAMKDVNNYIAITTDDKVKAKGLYAEAGLQKNPTMPVCSRAATQYLLDGTLPEAFVRKAKDFVNFTAIRNVKGGGEQNGVGFGRVARWYMTTESLPPLRYLDSGNKVPKTDGARVCMTLPNSIPKDLNRQWYVDEAYSMLEDMGVTVSER